MLIYDDRLANTDYDIGVSLQYQAGLCPLSPRPDEVEEKDRVDAEVSCSAASPSAVKYSSFLTSTGLSSTGEGSSSRNPEPFPGAAIFVCLKASGER